MSRSACLGLLALLATSCGERAQDETVELRATRGVILISLDTLRADHLGCYGYHRPTSPFLDRLARRAVLFEQAVAQYPSTLTSHMSMFTGRYPAEHRVYPPDAVLAPEIPTVPEILSGAGFRTAGFTEGGFMRGRFGFRRGFDRFKARDRSGRRDMERTFARGVEFLRGVGEDSRFFLFLHTYAAHTPYDPPEEYRRLYWQEDPPDTFPPTGPLLAKHNETGALLPDDVVAYFEALYDATINYIDDVVADFFQSLAELGLATDTSVVITADHGEELQDHGKMNHTQLYQEVMRMPLVVVHPDVAEGRRYGGLVESVDLAPTLLDLAGVPAKGTFSGESLAPLLLEPSRPPRGSLAYAEAPRRRAVYRHDGERLFHLLAASDGSRELYEAVTDPGETTDLVAALPDVAAALEEQLEELQFEPVGSAPERELDDEVRKSLRALGYLD